MRTMENVKRLYENIIGEHLGMFRQMVFLSGPRQVGKTTIAKTFASNYLNIDNHRIGDECVLCRTNHKG